MMDKFEQLESLRARLWERCQKAYCDMLNAYWDMRSVERGDKSLCREIKVDREKFGRKEMNEQLKMGEILGRHHALAEVCREIEELIEGAE